jgi:hypothetical protein
VADSTPGPGDDRGPNSYPLKPRFEYRAPSFLWEHRYLLIVFALVLIVATVVLFRIPHRRYPPGLEPPPPQPIYVIPDRPASSAQ